MSEARFIMADGRCLKAAVAATDGSFSPRITLVGRPKSLPGSVRRLSLDQQMAAFDQKQIETLRRLSLEAMTVGARKDSNGGGARNSLVQDTPKVKSIATQSG